MTDFHSPDVPMPTDTDLERVRERMRSFIFPNRASNEEEEAAFEQAVIWQYEHDATAAAAMEDLPPNVSRYTADHFTVEFREAASMRANICPAAYSLLLRKGLLYRGLEGRCV